MSSGEDVVRETINFIEGHVFPQLALQWRSEMNAAEEQVIPHRLPLKRRLAEFRYASTTVNRRTSPLVTAAGGTATVSATGLSNTAGLTFTGPTPTSSQSATTGSTATTSTTNAAATAITTSLTHPPSGSGPFLTNLWAIERFRDITPALVVAIFDDSLVLEPGDIGPLPLNHPVAQELIHCINTQMLTTALVEALREHGAPFYDGCIVVGVVDYRRWAFGLLSTPKTAPPPDPTPSFNQQQSACGSGLALNTNAMAQITPEMHKILLKPTYQTIISDLSLLLLLLPSPLSVATPTVVVTPVSTSTSVPMPAVSTATPTQLTPTQSTPTRSTPPSATSTPFPSSSLDGCNSEGPATRDKTMQALELESRLLMATQPPLCLDPNPMVFRLLTTLNYDAKKFNCLGGGRLVGRGTKSVKMAIIGSRTISANQMIAPSLLEGIRSPHLEAFLKKIRPSHTERLLKMPQQSQHQQRFCLLGLVEEWQSRKANADAEPMYGLDARKDPSRLKLQQPPSLSWLQPNQSLWRTLRFEERSERPVQHYTAHVIVTSIAASRSPRLPPPMMATIPSSSVRFQVVLRMGRSPCTSENGTMLQFNFAAKAAAEAYVEQLKQTMAIEGKSCVADVSNPNAMANFALRTNPPLPTTESTPNGHAIPMPPSSSSSSSFAGTPTIPATLLPSSTQASMQFLSTLPNTVRGTPSSSSSSFGGIGSISMGGAGLRHTLVYGSPQNIGPLRPASPANISTPNVAGPLGAPLAGRPTLSMSRPPPSSSMLSQGPVQMAISMQGQVQEPSYPPTTQQRPRPRLKKAPNT